jgi:hypothetical protein
LTGLPKLSKLIMGTQIRLTARWERKEQMPEDLSTRPLPKGILVRYKDLENKEQRGSVKDAGLYMLWVEDLENKDVLVFIRYEDVVAAFGQPGI